MNIELMKKKRKELGLTQNELAEKCGVSKNTIYNYENGKSEPNKETLNILAEIFNVPVLELMLNEDKEKILKHSNYDELLTILENNVLEKIEKVLIKKYKNITKKYINNKKIAQNILFILKSITGKEIIYSPSIEKVIFFNIEDSTDIILYDFIVIEQYILNITSMIENLEKNNDLFLNTTRFVNLLDYETTKYNIYVLKNELEIKQTELKKGYNKILGMLLEQNSSKHITNDKFNEIKLKYEEFEQLINNIKNKENKLNLLDVDIIDEKSEDLLRKIKKEYDKFENKYFEQSDIIEGDNNE